ncbi:MAG: hypothetical protein AAGE98_05300 [Actinomycetota bacterium]
MRRFALAPLPAIVVGLTVGLTASPASACSCMFEGDEVSLGEYDAVFFGAIVDIREDADSDVWLVRVDSIVKGEPASFTTIETSTSTASCGIEMPVDESAVFFVDDNFRLPSGEYVASLCSPTRTVSATDQVLADREARLPAEADPSVLSAFETGVVDAPDEVEEPSDLPAEEEVLEPDEESTSDRDRAELEAAADPPADAVLVGGPGVDAEPNETNRAAQVLVIGLVVVGAAVLGFELRRRST